MGNYPQFEPTHAQRQVDVDVAFTRRVNTIKCVPDFRLYIRAEERLPNFFALDIEDPLLVDHLSESLSLKEEANKKMGRRPSTSDHDHILQFRCVLYRKSIGGRLHVCRGASASSVHRRDRRNRASVADFQEPWLKSREPVFDLSLWSTLGPSGGGVHSDAYETLLSFLANEREAKRLGKSTSSLIERGRVTGFVAMGSCRRRHG